MLIKTGRELRQAILQKSQPTLTDVHVSQPLTNISVAYLQKLEAYVAARRIFPIVPVQKQADLYWRFDQGDFLRDEAKPRAPGTESAGGGFGLDTASYSCKVDSFHFDIPDQIRDNADSVLAYDSTASEFVMQILEIRRERKFFTAYFTAGVWGTDIQGVASGLGAGEFLQWNLTTSMPLRDIDAGKILLAQQGYLGLKKKLLLGLSTFYTLRDHPAIRDQFKYTSDKSVTIDMLAKYFDVDEVVVSMGAFNTANQGAAASMSFFAGKHALLVAVPETPTLMSPSAGYTFAWTGHIGSSNGIRTKKFRMEHLGTDRIEGDMAYDMKVTGTNLGVFYIDAIP